MIYKTNYRYEFTWQNPLLFNNLFTGRLGHQMYGEWFVNAAKTSATEIFLDEIFNHTKNTSNGIMKWFIENVIPWMIRLDNESSIDNIENWNVSKKSMNSTHKKRKSVKKNVSYVTNGHTNFKRTRDCFSPIKRS